MRQPALDSAHPCLFLPFHIHGETASANARHGLVVTKSNWSLEIVAKATLRSSKSIRLRDEVEQNQHLDELLTSSFGWNSSLKVRSQSEFARGQ
jgi:hypothetical protein